MKKRSILDCPVQFDKSDFLSLVSLAAGWSIAVQNRMGELVIGDSGWNVDIKGGTIAFGEKRFRSAMLGTESHISGTWLWSWANTEANLPEIVSAPSRRAKRLMPEVAEFANGKFHLDELHTGHNLAMVCCAASETAMCYYRCPYSDGAAFVTVEGLPDEVFAPLTAEQLLRQTMEIISAFYCDHRLLAAGMLWLNETDFTEEGGCITAQFTDRRMLFVFEQCGGLSRLADVRVESL
ncbi:MAG: DUF6882 domain-containing protein [Oscillospiraceae bacterium]